MTQSLERVPAIQLVSGDDWLSELPDATEDQDDQLDAVGARLHDALRDLVAFQTHAESERASFAERELSLRALEEELRLRETRAQADSDMRIGKLDARARELAAREERVAVREQELAGYIGELHETLQRRDAEWWTKQLGHAPAPLA